MIHRHSYFLLILLIALFHGSCSFSHGSDAHTNQQVSLKKSNSIANAITKEAGNSFFPPFLCGGITLVVGAIIWRASELWNRKKHRNRKLAFGGIIMAGILLILLSWRSFRRILMALIAVCAGIGIIYFLVRVKSKHRNRPTQVEHTTPVDQTQDLIQKLRELERENAKYREENRQLKTKIGSITKDKSELLEENVALGEELDKLKVELSSRQHITNNQTTPSISEIRCTIEKEQNEHELYAESILDGLFTKVRDHIDDDSIFVLDLKDAESASVSLLPNAHQRVLANSAYIDGCEKRLLGNSSVSVIPGMARKVNGKWQIEKKPIVTIS